VVIVAFKERIDSHLWPIISMWYPDKFWEVDALQWTTHTLLKMANHSSWELSYLETDCIAWSLTNFKRTSLSSTEVRLDKSFLLTRIL
jgi:hypothetical protein